MPPPWRSLAALALALVPALPVRADPTPPDRGAVGSVCAALSVLAGSAGESRRRGVPLESALLIADLRARDHGVSPERRRRVAHAVAEGYRAASPEEAERVVLRRCNEGGL